MPVQRYAVRQAEGELYRTGSGRTGMSKYIEESNCSDRKDRYNQHHVRTSCDHWEEFRLAGPPFNFRYINCLLLTRCVLDEIRDVSKIVWRLY